MKLYRLPPFLCVLIPWVAVSCAGPKSTSKSYDAVDVEKARTETADFGDAEADATVDPRPTRVVWEDYHRSGSAASRLVLVTPAFADSARKLREGRIEPGTKVVEPDIMDALIDSLDAEGFSKRATEVDPRTARSMDASVKAAIIVERDGKRRSILQILGSGETPAGRDAVSGFVRSKESILAVYNATFQLTSIVKKH